MAQEGDVSPDCAILRGFLAKEEEKSDWHPLEHKDGKRECRPHQNEKSKVLAMKSPTGDAPKATAANIPTSQATPAQLPPPAPVTMRPNIATPRYTMHTPRARHRAEIPTTASLCQRTLRSTAVPPRKPPAARAHTTSHTAHHIAQRAKKSTSTYKFIRHSTKWEQEHKGTKKKKRLQWPLYSCYW